MGIYNFQKRFAPFILNGSKQHTIRSKRKHPDKPGNLMHLYTGLRHPGAKRLAAVPCTNVEEIQIVEVRRGGGSYYARMVVVNETRLSPDECETLARLDGFDSFESMMAFWNGRLPFDGHIIHWSWAKRVGQ